jgi:hypothetical protein
VTIGSTNFVRKCTSLIYLLRILFSREGREEGREREGRS